MAHDIRGLEKKITDLSDALAHLSSAEDFRHLIQIIRRPGWTTPAEFLLVSGAIQGMQAQVTALAGMKKAVMEASEKVGAPVHA